jgi:hypothetical protein
MITFASVLFTLLSAMTIFIAIGMGYTMYTDYTQSKSFGKHLKVGDKTSEGTVKSINAEMITIARDDIEIHISNVKPPEIKKGKYPIFYIR